MILVLAGTRDGREIAQAVAAEGLSVLASVTTAYGKELLPAAKLRVWDRPLGEAGWEELLRCESVEAVVDATHPYAMEASRLAMRAAQAHKLPYIRYERPETPLPVYEKLKVCPDMTAAAQASSVHAGTVFLTVGSRQLAAFTTCPQLSERRLVARVLPEISVLTECMELGLSPRDVVAMQGPFSHALNVALFREYQAGVVVTKNSGQIGGSDTKFTAAKELDLPLIVVERPKLEYPLVVESMQAVLDELFRNK